MKRALALALCLLLIPAALAETYLIGYEMKKDYDYVTYDLLLRDDGTAVLGPDDCSFVRELTDPFIPEDERRYSVGSPTEFWTDAGNYRSPMVALADANGDRITGFDYADITALRSGDFAYTRPDGTAGILRPDGTALPLGRYSEIFSFREGWLCIEAMESYDSPGALVYRDAKGADIDTGLHCVYIEFPEDDPDHCVLYGVPEWDRNEVCLGPDLKPCFDTMYSYISLSHGRAMVCDATTGLTGLVDMDGTVLIPLAYESVTSFTGSDGTPALLCLEPDRLGFEIRDGETLEVRATVSLRDIAGVANASVYDDSDGTILAIPYDGSGNDISALHFDPFGRPLEEGPQIACNMYYGAALGEPQRKVAEGTESDAPCWLVDLDGNRRSDDYQSLMCSLWKDGHGRFVFSTYDMIQEEDGGTSIDWNTRRAGVIDEDGNVLLDAVYGAVTVFDLDRYWVTQGTRTGMVDGAGHWYYAIDDYAYLMD